MRIMNMTFAKLIYELFSLASDVGSETSSVSVYIYHVQCFRGS